MPGAAAEVVDTSLHGRIGDVAEVPGDEILDSVRGRDGDVPGVVCRLLGQDSEIQKLPCERVGFPGGFKQRNSVEGSQSRACGGGIAAADLVDHKRGGKEPEPAGGGSPPLPGDLLVGGDHEIARRAGGEVADYRCLDVGAGVHLVPSFKRPWLPRRVNQAIRERRPPRAGYTLMRSTMLRVIALARRS